jgi:uncharacterized membrane protein
MDKTIRLGRYFFAISMAAFGIQQFIIADFVPGLVPVSAGMPGRSFLVYLTGLVLIIAGASVLANQKARLMACLLGLLWFLWVILLHVPKLAANPRDGGEWTTAFETLAIGGAALVLAGTLPVERPDLRSWERAMVKALPVGRYLFGISLPVFGILHFIYLDYVAGAIPAWIPAPTFWAYLTGVAHIAAGLSIVINVKARLAALLLGWMFGLWVLLLHIPRAVASSHNRNEWSSTIIALAMCGGSLLIAGSLIRKETVKSNNSGEIKPTVSEMRLD